MANENEKIYKISKHAKERYAERIMGRDSFRDIQVYLLEHNEKIDTDINKMITYGTLIFSGKQQKGNFTNVYSKDCWIVLVDPSNDTVITLYKIDIIPGDDDFNKKYVEKMLLRLKDTKDRLEQVKMDTINESNMYRERISENNDQIAQYRGYIKNLEGLNNGYKEIIDNNVIKVDQAEKDVVDVLNTLISKKEF